jgi:hypothetical protein
MDNEQNRDLYRQLEARLRELEEAEQAVMLAYQVCINGWQGDTFENPLAPMRMAIKFFKQLGNVQAGRIALQTLVGDALRRLF